MGAIVNKGWWGGGGLITFHFKPNQLITSTFCTFWSYDETNGTHTIFIKEVWFDKIDLYMLIYINEYVQNVKVASTASWNTRTKCNNVMVLLTG